MLEKFVRPPFSNQDAKEKSRNLVNQFKQRRTIREFIPANVDEEIVMNAIKVASLAPNGANKQPWKFSLIKNKNLRHKIRTEAESYEKEFYQGEQYPGWKQDLKHLHTNEEKTFLTDADYLLAIFAENFGINENGQRTSNYFVKESVGIATGFLISSLHQCGLNVLTYTPSKMQFLCETLNRPRNEKLYLLLAIGVAHPEAEVPSIEKKAIKEILTYH
jgi:iodotyrosine deiodinase